VRLFHLIRYRYPYTVAAGGIAVASVAALWFPSWRKLGVIVLALLASSFLARFTGEIGYRWSRQRDARRDRL
jgi:hypothetical protein